MTENNYITTMEATRITGMTAQKIRNLCNDSKIASIKKSGRWLVDRESIEHYLENNPKARSEAYGDIEVTRKKAFYPIRGFDCLYATTEDGKVVNFSNGQELSTNPNKETGYVQVWLYQQGKRIPKQVHDLVVQTQGDNVWAKKVVHHINKDSEDNRVNNLLPVTEEEHGLLHRLLNANNIGLMYQHTLNKYDT